MALPLKDIHVHVSHEAHAVLSVIAEAEGLPLSTWVKQTLIEAAEKKARSARMIATECERVGFPRFSRVAPGSDGFEGEGRGC